MRFRDAPAIDNENRTNNPPYFGNGARY